MMREILEAINDELIRVTAMLNSERRSPVCDPDMSDDKIRDYKERIIVLRRIRMEIEDSMI